MASERRPRTRQSLAHVPSTDGDGPSMDQENLTTDVATTSLLKAANDAVSKKARSKSIGPGGIAALKEDAGNKRKVPAPLPKSILKPTIPLSPLREIPSRKTSTQSTTSPSRAASPKIAPSPQKSPSAGPRSSPQKAPSSKAPDTPTHEGSNAANNEERDELAASLQDQEREKRQKQREEIQKQRDARRKSMANRRVSFAPEATLHTWDLIDEMQDSTTSSSATTRRASAASNASGIASPNSHLRASTMSGDETEVPSTPTKQTEDEIASASSPAHQRDAHQKKNRRRSSTVLSKVNESNDSPLSSPRAVDSLSAVNDGDVEMLDADPVEASSGGSDTEEEDAANVSVLDTPQRPHSAAGVNDETSSHGIENEDVSMELAVDEVTAAFQPFAKSTKMKRTPPATMLGKENVNPFSEAFKHAQGTSSAQSAPDEEELSMDMTRAQGSIISTQRQGTTGNRNVRSSRKSVANRRRSSGSEFSGDGTMELTTAVGSIQHDGEDEQDLPQSDQNEELSMEFTGVIGGIQKTAGGSTSNHASNNDLASDQLLFEHRRASAEHTLNDGMDMTAAIGKIEPAITSRFDAENQTVHDGVTMDMTRPVGLILGNDQNERFPSRSPARVEASEPSRSPSRMGWREKPRVSITTSATGSPTRSQPRSATRVGHQAAGALYGSPLKSPQTPSRQLTPKPAKAPSPSKPSPLKNVTMRTPSPKRLFKEEIRKAKSSPASTAPDLFHLKNGTSRSNSQDGIGAPSFAKRRASDIHGDKAGLGSPKVASLLDRRESIGKTAPILLPTDFFSAAVRFEDPKAIEQEVNQERQEEYRRESGQFILEKETDAIDGEKDVTTSLKEAIGSMTPRKSQPKPRSRKSFATGSAKGLLGKRPAELDDEEDEDGTPKALRGREASPVKKIRLQGPPSKSETTGRGAQMKPLAGPAFSEQPFTPRTASPTKALITTPKSQGRFKDAESLPSAQKPIPTMGSGDGPLQDGIDEADGKEIISLQEFLNLTNIRFMDLTMTKRRHKAPPTPHQRGPARDEELSKSHDETQYFQDCVVAGVCTIPMLELYQHSCRELKKYISEGRDIVREIESDTLQENPPLFREYTSAAPAQRAVMDDQFKNMKTHARHVSKSMWYEWRMKLLDSLKQGLYSAGAGMDRDATLLEQQDALLQSSLPEIVQEHANLTKECERLESRASELAESNQEELHEARQSIVAMNQDIETVKEQIKKHQETITEADEAIENAQEAKVEYMQAIKEARRVREEFRGWSVKEVNGLRANVEAIEARTGWSVVSVEATTMTMAYRDQLELFFDIGAFAPMASSGAPSKPIGLAYLGETNEQHPQPLSTEKRFFLQLMRAHLQSIDQSHTHLAELLKFVSTSWNTVLSVAAEVSRLDDECPTRCNIVSDERLTVKCMVLLKNVQTKVEVHFEVHAGANSAGLQVSVNPAAEVVYGEPYKSEKMREFLRSRIGKVVDVDHVGGWTDSMMELKRRLVAQGRKN